MRNSIQAAKRRPGVDCGSDHELLIARFRLKLKKVGKTTRPFRSDLNEIPYTVEVTNRFKELDLIDKVPEELWMEARILEWVAISFFNACMLSRCSHVQFCATPWTAAHQAPLSMGFSRQEYWSGLPLPSP